ncbi:LysR family transcriptional regulator [Bradyrhizobium sp.]|uniref:LysR family transcriptional regulator n=1 Tax=Bradyrhizobium sp. TaxID=376 RepID=UPI00343BD600
MGVRMPTIANRGGPHSEHAGAIKFCRTWPDWDAVRSFLELVRHGSFRAAAEHLRTSTNALRRKIDDLERSLGTPLVTRHVDGIRPTAEGDEILLAAKKMEEAAFGLLRARDRATPAMSGEVRLGVTEAFGAFWVGPRLVELQRAYPKLSIDLTCAMRSADVLRLEADVSIQLTRPTNPDVKIVRLGRIHSMPAAAPSYLAIYGTPRTVDDLRKHRLALQFADQTKTQENLASLFPGVPLKELVTFSTNNSTALLWAIIKGAGIGWSPTYIHAMGPKMVPLDIDAIFPHDIWLTYHPDAARVPRVRRLIDWIMENFDPKTFPWFRDEFIHPHDLPRHYHGPPVVNLFEGVAWDPRGPA